MIISVLDRLENTVGKGEDAGYKHFLLFPQCFRMPSIGSLKVGIDGKELGIIKGINKFINRIHV